MISYWLKRDLNLSKKIILKIYDKIKILDVCISTIHNKDLYYDRTIRHMKELRFQLDLTCGFQPET